VIDIWVEREENLLEQTFTYKIFFLPNQYTKAKIELEVVNSTVDVMVNMDTEDFIEYLLSGVRK
jgi:hypothetical protein